MIQGLVHYGLHFLAPLVIAIICFRTQWIYACANMLSTFVIDLDHLLATPLFDPNRCSIDFHFLHSYIAIGIYMGLLLPTKTRLFGLGLCIHILADACDCLLM